MKKNGNGLNPFLTEVSSKTICQFNNPSSLEGKGQLYTCYYLSISSKRLEVQVFSFAEHSSMT